MKNAFVEFARALQGTFRSQRQEKIREVELTWSNSELADFRVFVMGLHSSQLLNICHALADAHIVPLLELLGDFAKRPDMMNVAFQSIEKTPYVAQIFLAKRLIVSPKPELRVKVCEMLGNAGPQAKALLEEAIADPDTMVQQAAINAISHGTFKSLGPKICHFLQSSDQNVRCAALRAIAHLGVTSPTLNTDLLSILADRSQCTQARRLAAGVLAKRQVGGGRTILLEALRNPDAEYTLHMLSAEFLSFYTDPEAIRALLYAIDDRDTTVAKTARMSLSRKRSKTLVAVFAQLIDDENSRIAELAAEMLGGQDAHLVEGILTYRLKTERRIPVVNALGRAMCREAIPGTWRALIAKQQAEGICSPAFFSVLADAVEENNLLEFASFFDKFHDAAIRRVIMDRLALLARTSPVTPEIESLAIRVLNEPNETFHIPAARILAHVVDLNPQKVVLVLEHLAGIEEDPQVMRIVDVMLRNKGGALAELFWGASPSVAGLLAQAAAEAVHLGEKGDLLFHTVANWVRSGVPRAGEALQAMAFLSPSTLVKAMTNCADQLFLIKAWSGLPEKDRILNYPNFYSFFANASPEDAVAGIQILQKLQDPRILKVVAYTAFSSREPAVRKAALTLTRELIFAPREDHEF